MIKNLLSITLILCLLLQGCKSSQHVPAPKSKTHNTSVQENPEPKKMDFSHLKELSKEELEKEIQECEEYLANLHNFDQNKDPEEQLAQIMSIPFIIFMYPYYFQAKFEYIEKYGTEEQKQALKEFKTSSDGSQKDFYDLMKVLGMHPSVYDFHESQSSIQGSPAPEIESQKKKNVNLGIRESLNNKLKNLFK